MKTLITAAQIKARIAEMGQEITTAYADGGPVLLVTILNGSIIFAADLVRQLRLPLQMDVVGVSSYRGTVSSGEVQFWCTPRHPVAGKRILLAEDIFDTGITLERLAKELYRQGAASVEAAVLLERKIPRPEGCFRPRWHGFEIEEGFLVGFGLDYNERWRNLRDICVLEAADLEAGS